jgi:hypothetical protein
MSAEPTEIDCDVRASMDYYPGDGPLRLSRTAAIRRAENAGTPDPDLIKMLKDLPSGAEISLTPVRNKTTDGPLEYVVSVDMKITLPDGP